MKLSEILADDTAEQPKIETTLEPETIGQGQVENEGVEVAQAGVETPVPPTERLPQDVYEPLRAVRDENKALKAEIEALQNKSQPQQTQQAPWQQPSEIPSIWEDEQGWQDSFTNQVTQQAVFAAQQAVIKAEVKKSEMLMRQAEPEFETLQAEYLALERENPGLGRQVISDPHPWNKAIQIVKNHRAMQELGATSVADIEAKIRAEYEAKYAAPAAAAPKLPTSLASTQSASPRGAVVSGPMSLTQILGG